MEFEDILRDVGEYDRYQRLLLLFFLVPSSALLPWFALNNLFMLSEPDHWCNVPEVVDSNLTLEQQQKLIRPMSETGPSGCEMYSVNYSQVLLNLPDLSGNWTEKMDVLQKDWKTQSCNQGWQYDKTWYDDTAVTQWNLVCKKNYLPSLILTLSTVGSILGTPVYGYLSDRIGRRLTFFIITSVTVLSGVSSVLVPSFAFFALLRLINGGLMPSIFQVPYIILVELVGPETRTRMNGIANISWTVGLCALPGIAYLCRHWEIFGLITTSCTFIFFFYWRVLPESPRWLVTQERYEEAAIILCHISKVNDRGLVQPGEMELKLRKLGDIMKNQKEEEKYYLLSEY